MLNNNWIAIHSGTTCILNKYRNSFCVETTEFVGKCETSFGKFQVRAHAMIHVAAGPAAVAAAAAANMRILENQRSNNLESGNKN